MSKREPGLDLIRCIALLFVISFHSFLYNGYYYEPQSGIAMWLWGSFRWLSVSCIGLFLMLTGYLKSDRISISGCCRGLVPVLSGYGIASAVSIPIRHFVLGEVHSLSWWFWAFLGFRGVYYGWYVEMYVGLTLLSPFVNLVLDRLHHSKNLLLLAGILLFLTAFPGATPLGIIPDYWRSCYPLTYYILGAVIRRIQPQAPPLFCIPAALAVALFLGAGTVLSTDGTLNEALTWEFADIWITIAAVLLFVALYRLRVSHMAGRVLAVCARGCYGGYLLSHLLDAWCYSLMPEWRNPRFYLQSFLCVTVPIFLISIMGGSLLNHITPIPLSRRKGASV